jgi:hypothetical protein
MNHEIVIFVVGFFSGAMVCGIAAVCAIKVGLKNGFKKLNMLLDEEF